MSRYRPNTRAPPSGPNQRWSSTSASTCGRGPAGCGHLCTRVCGTTSTRKMLSVSPNADEKVAVSVDGRTLTLTNLAKVLYPETGFTKAEVLSYYQQVAAVLLPHIAGRPLTLKRYHE